MALCASVMAGIYAAPVMAAELDVVDEKVELTVQDINSTMRDHTFDIGKGKVYARELQAGAYVNINNTYLRADPNNRNALIIGGIPNEYGVMQGGTTFDFLETNQKIQNINNNTEPDKTAFDGSVIADSFGTTKVNGNRAFWVNKDGMMEAAYGKFAVDAEGNITTMGTVDGVDVSALSENVGGIERSDITDGVGTTTIEGDFAVNGKDNTFGSKNGSFTVNAEDGTFTAANGAFKVREGVGETVIAGSIISSKDQFGNQGTFNGSNLNLQSADHTRNTSIDAGTAYFVKDGSGTSIDGGDITAETLNGKVIDDLVEGSDIADDLANIGGIERSEGAGDPGTGTTTIENNLKVSGDKINMFGDTGLTFDEGTMNGVNVISVSGNIGFNGSNVHFSYGSDGKTTTLGGLALTVDQIATDVSAIKEKTDHITVDDKGNVTISADDGSSLTVGNGGTSTGQGGQVTTDGDHNVTGDMNVDGSLTVGDTEGSQTIIEDDKVTTGEISADKGNIGNSHFNENGITVGAAGGQHTTITDTTVDATNGYFDNLQADKANIGGVGLEDGTVTADKVVTGNTTLDNEGLNVGGQTSVTADGVNVGGNGGTTVSKDGVSIADKTIISDHDVVINEGTADRVSLSETADRVGNLEQGVSELNNRVGELEDRIDKVGAMAAAIANLRTMGYDPAAPTEVAVGIGQYRDETGAALGLFHYPNRDFMLSLSVSTSGDEVMGGIGATWKFGRKSPEKVAEIKKAQAEADARRAEEAKLAKAEEMKQAAKEAKIKAQQERHAKLAAERAAQAEAAK